MIATTRIIMAIFTFGFGLGITLSYMFFKTEELNYRVQISRKMQELRLHDRQAHGMEHDSIADINEVMLGYSNGQFVHAKIKTTTTTPPPELVTDEELQNQENIKAIELSNAVRILCFVLTSPATHKQKAIHVKKTWGKRCNVLLFITTEADPDLEPVVILENIHEDRSYLWAKTKTALREIYDNYLDEVDWVLKADDDTYVIMENLRYMLRNYSSNESLYFGHTFRPTWLPYDYMSGGAGYVMSKRTVIKLVEEAFLSNNTSQCREDHINGTELSEDLEIGRCINLLKIQSSDSRDVLGRLRFFPFSPDVHLFHNTLNNTEFDWWWKYTKYSHEDGLECCSDTAIAFHYVTAQNMYLYEYFLYHLRPFGTNRKSEAAQSILPTTEEPEMYNLESDPEEQNLQDESEELTLDDGTTTVKSVVAALTISKLIKPQVSSVHAPIARPSKPVHKVPKVVNKAPIIFKMPTPNIISPLKRPVNQNALASKNTITPASFITLNSTNVVYPDPKFINTSKPSNKT